MTPADTMRAAVEALEYMLTEKADYMIRNHLGNPANEHSTKLGNSALSLLRSALEGGEPEPVAWMRDDGRPEIWTAKDKERAIKLTGLWLETAKHFTIPLYSIPPNTPVEAGKVGVAAGVAPLHDGKRVEQELAAAEVMQRAYEWYESSRKTDTARALEMAVLRHKTALASGVMACPNWPTCSSCLGCTPTHCADPAAGVAIPLKEQS